MRRPVDVQFHRRLLGKNSPTIFPNFFPYKPCSKNSSSDVDKSDAGFPLTTWETGRKQPTKMNISTYVTREICQMFPFLQFTSQNVVSYLLHNYSIILKPLNVVVKLEEEKYKQYVCFSPADHCSQKIVILNPKFQ